MSSGEHPLAVKNRRQKVLAMVAVIDANFLRQNPKLDPYDQAGRIALASRTWSDKVWHQIAIDAGFQSKKVPGDETRKLVREVYEGRSKAPLASREAS